MRQSTTDTAIKANLILMLVLILAWGINAYKLTQCDFESDYKCEAIHAVGLVGPASVITVWFGTDEGKDVSTK